MILIENDGGEFINVERVRHWSIEHSPDADCPAYVVRADGAYITCFQYDAPGYAYEESSEEFKRKCVEFNIRKDKARKTARRFIKNILEAAGGRFLTREE